MKDLAKVFVDILYKNRITEEDKEIIKKIKSIDVNDIDIDAKAALFSIYQAIWAEESMMSNTEAICLGDEIGEILSRFSSKEKEDEFQDLINDWRGGK